MQELHDRCLEVHRREPGKSGQKSLEDEDLTEILSLELLGGQRKSSRKRSKLEKLQMVW